jgi:superfamily II DNA or RNA helicase
VGRHRHAFHQGRWQNIAPKLHCLSQPLVDGLKRLIIRHTKAQRIRGAAALALPMLETKTKWLKFTPAERAKYAAARKKDKAQRDKLVERKDVTDFGLRMALLHAMQHCAGANTKLKAVMADLAALKAREPHMHVVIFTQHMATHGKLVRHLQKQKGITVYEVTGKVQIKKRHELIKEFQKGEAKAKAIVCMPVRRPV